LIKFHVRLPELQEELQGLLEETQKRLSELPSPPSPEPVNEIIRLVTKFTRNLARHIEGSPEGDGLLQSIRPYQNDFKQAIRATAPEFRPYDSASPQSGLPEPPSFLSQEERAVDYPPTNMGICIHIDEVMNLAQKYVWQ
jgi:hypothetical protein